MNLTLDGYFSGTSCEMDWHFARWTPEMGDVLCGQLAQADTILLGRITYNAMAAYFPAKMNDPNFRGEDFAFANMMNQYCKQVFSKTLKTAYWNNSKLVKGNIQDEVNKLKKSQGRNIIVYGSGRLVNSLIGFNLVDEYQLWIHPVLLGIGKPLFTNLPYHLQLKMMDCITFQSGVVMIRYLSKQT